MATTTATEAIVRGTWGVSFAAMLAGVAGMGSVQAQVTIPQEYEKTVKAAGEIGALGDGLFGENVSFYTGATTFSVVDVSLPGSNGLPVEIRRRFSVESRDPPDRLSLEATALMAQPLPYKDMKRCSAV